MATHSGTLRKFGDRVLYRTSPESAEEIPVRVVWARPLTGKGKEISILAEEKKEELAFLSSPEELEEESRRIAMEEMEHGCIMPVIERVTDANARHGIRFWKAETDKGGTQFLMHSPETAVVEPTPDRMIIRDTMENVYEIPDVYALDSESQVKVDQVT